MNQIQLRIKSRFYLIMLKNTVIRTPCSSWMMEFQELDLLEKLFSVCREWLKTEKSAELS